MFTNLAKCIDCNAKDCQALVIESIDMKLIHSGKMFLFSKRISIPSETTVALIMKTSANLNTHYRMPQVSGSGPLYHDYYRGTVYTAETGANEYANIVNQNHQSSNTSNAQEFRSGVTVTDYGSQIILNSIYANKEGGHSLPGLGWLLAKDTVYSARIENIDNQVNAVTVNLFWFETLEGGN